MTKEAAPTTVYKYFGARKFALFEKIDCPICGREDVPGLDEKVKADDDDAEEIASVCEDCLVAGALEGKGCFINEGDASRLVAAIRKHDPKLDPASAAALAVARTTELSCRTPKPPEWQARRWPIHCGDYCRFEREVGWRDIEEVAPEDEDTAEFLVSHLAPGEHRLAPQEYEKRLPDALSDDPRKASSFCVYEYRCVACNEVLYNWDCN